MKLKNKNLILVYSNFIFGFLFLFIYENIKHGYLGININLCQ